MSESCLSQKISLCRCIETLNDDECLQVIRLFQKYQHLNQFLIKIILKMTEKMNVESLQHINNEMKQIISNNKYVRSQQQSERNNDNKFKNGKKSGENVVFPLIQLPIDLISKTSLFLNETDIFNFEQCCRLFYRMINNLSYLKQSNNFKQFTLNDKRLDQMCQAKYSFYKFSQANAMEVTLCGLDTIEEETNQNITKFINDTQLKWQQAKQIDKCYDHWLTNLFKSIKSLKLSADSTLALLDKLPMQILFDPQSKLERFCIDHFWNIDAKFGHLQEAIDEFERQYLQLKEKYQQQGKKLNKLQCLDYSALSAYDAITGPRYIEAEHLILFNIGNSFPAQRLLSTINNHILTCYRDCNLCQLNAIDCNIDTLRLIGFDTSSKTDILVNDKLIQALNLHGNLVNLTIEVNTDFDTSFLTIEEKAEENVKISKWMKVIEKILCKQHYHKLKNVNILIKMSDQDIEQVFNLLKANISILKCQFNQLNIGLKMNGVVTHWPNYCTIEWNQQIDEKFLDKKQQEMDGDEIKCQQWLNQWTN